MALETTSYIVCGQTPAKPMAATQQFEFGVRWIPTQSAGTSGEYVFVCTLGSPDRGAADGPASRASKRDIVSALAAWLQAPRAGCLQCKGPDALCGACAALGPARALRVGLEVSALQRGLSAPGGTGYVSQRFVSPVSMRFQARAVEVLMALVALSVARATGAASRQGRRGAASPVPRHSPLGPIRGPRPAGRSGGIAAPSTARAAARRRSRSAAA